MATEKTDVVIIGVGAAGGILAAELGKAGMKVIGLERGPRLTTKDFDPHDELRYFTRQDLRPNIKSQPILASGTPIPPLLAGGNDNTQTGATLSWTHQLAPALILVYGPKTSFGGWLAEHGISVIFSLPGMVIATMFVSLPLVVRDVV